MNLVGHAHNKCSSGVQNLVQLRLLHNNNNNNNSDQDEPVNLRSREPTQRQTVTKAFYIRIKLVTKHSLAAIYIIIRADNVIQAGIR